jgi:hypothetical protein
MRARRIFKHFIPQSWHPAPYLERLTLRRSGKKIISGPFAGMKYVDRAVGSMIIPKLLGIYENELFGIIREIVADPPDWMIDVGAAEGYYAVGLARCCPKLQVTAFEMESEGRSLLLELAALNGVAERIDIRGRCDPAELKKALAAGEGRRGLVVCDCEGYEDILLDPAHEPALRKISILVELHERNARDLSEEMRRRFEPSHQIEEIWTYNETNRTFPFSTLYLRVMPKVYRDCALSEHRHVPMNWFWMKPRLPSG